MRKNQFPPPLCQQTRIFHSGLPDIFPQLMAHVLIKNGQNALFLKNLRPKIHMLMH